MRGCMQQAEPVVPRVIAAVDYEALTRHRAFSFVSRQATTRSVFTRQAAGFFHIQQKNRDVSRSDAADTSGLA